MKFLLYSDIGYEIAVEAFLVSRKYANLEHIPVVYYSVGFKSDLNYPNLEIREWEIDHRRPTFNYYKPAIMLDSLNHDDQMCFMDCDVVLSRRFNPELVVNTDFDFPIASSGPHEHVWAWDAYEVDGEEVVIRYDELKLMEYYGVGERTTEYLWASMISYNSECRDFIEEWESILMNPYLLKYHRAYYPFSDETAFNVTMWKRGITRYFDMIFFNTTAFESFYNVETNDDVHIERDTDYSDTRNDGKLYEMCNDSSGVQYYHGFKPGEELDKVTEWMRGKSAEKNLDSIFDV